jgi:hypothetical protein
MPLQKPDRVELPHFPVQGPDDSPIADFIREGGIMEAKKTPHGTFKFTKTQLKDSFNDIQHLQVIETKDSNNKSHYYLIQATDTDKDIIIITSLGVELTPQTHGLKISSRGLPEVDFKSIEKYTSAVLNNPRTS